jgi:hypothetical protein
MNANKVTIDGVRLDTLLRHYENVGILIQHAIQTKSMGGDSVLKRWDQERTDYSKHFDVQIVVDEVDSSIILK